MVREASRYGLICSPGRLVVGLVAAVTVRTAAGCRSDGEAVTEPVEPPITATAEAPAQDGDLAILGDPDPAASDPPATTESAAAASPGRRQPSTTEHSGEAYQSISEVDFLSGFTFVSDSGLRAAEVTVEDGLHENGAFGDPEYFRFAVHDVNFGDLTGDDVDDVVVPFST